MKNQERVRDLIRASHNALLPRCATTEQPIGKQHDDDMLMNSTPTLLEKKKKKKSKTSETVQTKLHVWKSNKKENLAELWQQKRVYMMWKQRL